ELPPSEWLRRGWPRAIAFAWLAALPLALSGPIRFLTGIGLGAALVVAVGVTVLGVSPFVRPLCARSRITTQALVAHAVVAIVGVFAAWLLHNPDFGGLASVVDRRGEMPVDAAIHVRMYEDFARRTPDIYVGFVSLYGFWDPIRQATGDVIVPAQVSFL